MNQKILELAQQAGLKSQYETALSPQEEQFVELLKHSIYNQVREELVDDAYIDAENNVEDRCYLHGNNGGIIDALVIIKNFGQDIEP